VEGSSYESSGELTDGTVHDRRSLSEDGCELRLEACSKRSEGCRNIRTQYLLPNIIECDQESTSTGRTIGRQSNKFSRVMRDHRTRRRSNRTMRICANKKQSTGRRRTANRTSVCKARRTRKPHSFPEQDAMRQKPTRSAGSHVVMDIDRGSMRDQLTPEAFQQPSRTALLSGTKDSDK